ncbi:hypothetical protein MRX96_007077 [Rhipicephalus microplus]
MVDLRQDLRGASLGTAGPASRDRPHPGVLRHQFDPAEQTSFFSYLFALFRLFVCNPVGRPDGKTLSRFPCCPGSAQGMLGDASASVGCLPAGSHDAGGNAPSRNRAGRVQPQVAERRPITRRVCSYHNQIALSALQFDRAMRTAERLPVVATHRGSEWAQWMKPDPIASPSTKGKTTTRPRSVSSAAPVSRFLVERLAAGARFPHRRRPVLGCL